MPSRPQKEQNLPKSLENQGFLGLNPDQSRAAQATPKRPLLIVAGAGTGKTSTLTSRVAYFLAEGVPGDQICAITFTNKAANEMKERITALVTRDGKVAKHALPFIGTFHAFGSRILRRHAALLGRSPGFVIFDDHDSFSIIKKILKDLERRKENPSTLYGKISAIKNGAVLEKESPLTQTVFARYEHALESQNAFDFDDLLQKTVWLFKKHPVVLKKYQAQYTHILIDEYQDLNDMQYELVRLLAADGASLSVVGDAEQTIYGWRGSNIEIFLRFPDDWKDAEMITLTQNYRSTQTILRAASGVIKENTYDTRVTRATDLWTENAEGKKVVLYEAYDEDTAAMWIAETIARTRSEEGSAAILYRTNAQSRALEQALLRRRIPYRVYGGLKFYERREIKDIVAALRYSINSNDALARERLEKAFTKRMFKALAEAFEREPDNATPLARIDLFMKTVDYLGYIESHLTNPRERRENIEELIHFAAGYTDIAEFISEIALLQATDALQDRRRAPEDGREVMLMTIHLAKGLEFDRVFVAGVSEGLLPHARSIGSKEEIQEERRLMYVAMTRARKELFLSFYGLPSRFIGEIPEDTLEFLSELGTEGKENLDYRDTEYEERYITLD
jgi:DNA helicase-2/ATP-dependent DNA helicase PcrA